MADHHSLSREDPIKMINTSRIETAGTTFNTMNLITLIKQKLSQIAAILTSNAGYESNLSVTGV